MVLTGTFCDPSLHGNRDKIGWNLIGFDDQSVLGSALRLLRRAPGGEGMSTTPHPQNAIR